MDTPSSKGCLQVNREINCSRHIHTHKPDHYVEYTLSKLLRLHSEFSSYLYPHNVNVHLISLLFCFGLFVFVVWLVFRSLFSKIRFFFFTHPNPSMACRKQASKFPHMCGLYEMRNCFWAYAFPFFESPFSEKETTSLQNDKKGSKTIRGQIIIYCSFSREYFVCELIKVYSVPFNLWHVIFSGAGDNATAAASTNSPMPTFKVCNALASSLSLSIDVKYFQYLKRLFCAVHKCSNKSYLISEGEN